MENHIIPLKQIKETFFWLSLVVLLITILLDLTGICHWPFLELTALFSLLLSTCFIKRTTAQQLRTLIHTCDQIIDKKPLTLYDGEGEIAVLSSKLDILSQRYIASLQQLAKDKIMLKQQIDNISHQLKTPLTAMQITEDLLLEMPMDKQTKRMIFDLQDRTTHLNHLIEQLLKLSRIEADAVQFDFQKHSFLDMMSELENSLATLLREAHVQLQYEMTDFEILCDRLWILEALENIIKNCIEKTPNQPLDIHVIHLEYSHLITIQDHGKGIQTNPPEKIFERFYHDKNSSGAGIGLSLAKEIIHAHHGNIHVENNHGACFKISLPIFHVKEHL